MICQQLWVSRWVLMLAIVFLQLQTLSFGQDSVSQHAAIERLTAMLQSIDPYRPSTEATETVQVIGSTSMDALAHGWVTGFKQFHPTVKVEITAGGSEQAISQLLKSPSSVAMFSRPVTNEELEDLKKKGLKNPVAFTVAREALSVFVHASNPISTMSGDQLRDVFTTDSHPGELSWGVLGAGGAWASKAVHVISRLEGSGTQKFVNEFVFSGAKLRPSVSEHASNAEVLHALDKDPTSIAICGYRSSGNSVKKLQLTKGASIIPSDDMAVLSGQYPLTRPLSLVIDIGQTDKKAIASQEFVRYALCQAGQTQAILVGFFPVDLPLLRAGLEKLSSGEKLR